MFVLKEIYELRSEALLTQIFVKLSAAIFPLQWFIFGGNCLLPPKIAKADYTSTKKVIERDKLRLLYKLNNLFYSEKIIEYWYF